MLQGSVQEGDADWKVLMQPIEDDSGYKMNSITVYAHNFVEIKSSGETSVS